MGNRFVTQGLSSEATHGTRDDKFRQTEAGRRPNETELATEEVETNSPKSTESHSGATNVGLEAKSSEANGREAKRSERKKHEEAKSDESPETKSREDAEERSASTVHLSLWEEENGASGRTKPRSGYEDQLWNRSPDLFSPSLDSVYETAKTERTNASRCPKDQQPKNTTSLPL